MYLPHPPGLQVQDSQTQKETELKQAMLIMQPLSSKHGTGIISLCTPWSGHPRCADEEGGAQKG